MNQRALTVVTALVLFGCGEKAQEARNAMDAVEQLARASDEIAEGQDEAEQFYQERREKGDTLAMGYAELQEYLPAPPSGYEPVGEPEGFSQSMGGFSMSQAEQTFTRPADADGNAPSIQVTLVDFGGSEVAYGMMALPMMMNISQEDAHRRMRTLTMDTPYTWASEEYNKDSKDAKVTAVTRYRYLITAEASNQTEDRSQWVKDLVEDIAKKFEGK
jgi:hypothetical protein